MSNSDDWNRRGSAWGIGDAGLGSLRVALLFGAGAVALALILAPIAENQAERMMYSSYQSGSGGVDFMSTGTTPQDGGGSYTVRRSVLQPSPNSVCIIRGNGMRTGDC